MAIPTPEPTPTPTVEPMPVPTVTVTATPTPEDVTALDLGSWPEWITAVVAFLALIGAALSVYFAHRAVRTSREANNITLAAYQDDVKERREAQARFVYALNEIPQLHHPGEVMQWPDTIKMTAANGPVFVPGSLRSIGGGITEATVAAEIRSTTVTVYNRSDEIVAGWMVSLYDRANGQPVGGVGVGENALPLLPGDSQTVRIDLLFDPSHHPHVGPVVEFRDSSGRFWRRRGSEPIELIRDTE